MQSSSRILIIGHGLVERSLTDHFLANGFKNVYSSTRSGLDAAIQPAVHRFFQDVRPEYVFLSSVKSGGIEANRAHPAEFIYDNMAAEANVIYAAWKFNVAKLLFIASSCIYPRECPQPIKEEYLLTAPLEATSEPYALAKIAGVKLCQAFRAQYGLKAVSMVPATLYGKDGAEDAKTSHVLGALIDKFRTAVKDRRPEVIVWGTGQPTREFLHVDDFVQACLFLMDRYDAVDVINAGTAEEISIKDLAQLVADAAGFKGRIVFDASKPDGAPRKCLDVSKIRLLGWSPKIRLAEGIKRSVV